MPNPSGWCGRGPVFHFTIYFAAPFDSPPVVHLGLTGFDLDQRDSNRLILRATQITTTGFVAEISTWRETRVYSVAFSWLALGRVVVCPAFIATSPPGSPPMFASAAYYGRELTAAEVPPVCRPSSRPTRSTFSRRTPPSRSRQSAARIRGVPALAPGLHPALVCRIVRPPSRADGYRRRRVRPLRRACLAYRAFSWWPRTSMGGASRAKSMSRSRPGCVSRVRSGCGSAWSRAACVRSGSGRGTVSGRFACARALIPEGGATMSGCWSRPLEAQEVVEYLALVPPPRPARLGTAVDGPVFTQGDDS